MLLTNPVYLAIKIFDRHSSVKLIRDNTILSEIFQIESDSLDDILKEIKNPNSVENGTFNNI